MKTVENALLKNYKVEVVEGHVVVPRVSTTLHMKNWLKVRIKKRYVWHTRDDGRSCNHCLVVAILNNILLHMMGFYSVKFQTMLWLVAHILHNKLYKINKSTRLLFFLCIKQTIYEVSERLFHLKKKFNSQISF